MTSQAARAPRALVLASAGIGVVGVTFGMARYGLGLLAPDIRATFHLSSAALGLLAAASYIAYVLTSITAGALSARVGPRAVVAAGGLCAVVGMAVAGAASTPAALFAGLLVAGASAGLVFPPFSDVVSGSLPPGRRSRVLAAVSSGSGWGVALAAPVALVAGSDWRITWLLFAAIAGAATAWALTVLPADTDFAGRAEVVRLRLGWFLCSRSSPLLLGALLVGLASSPYWTFAVDHLVNQGGLSSTQSRLFLALVGLASIGGSIGGDAVRRAGGRATFMLAALAEAISLLLLGIAPGSPVAVLGSALLFGAAYNTVLAVQVIWSTAVFAERPSAGLAAVMVMNAVGLLGGPPILGALADRAGFLAVFATGAGLILAVTILAPREPLEDPIGSRGAPA
jgi:predicted MFS family arabinose efflux permease